MRSGRCRRCAGHFSDSFSRGFTGCPIDDVEEAYANDRYAARTGRGRTRVALIAAAGHGGQVLVSSASAGLLEVGLRDLGRHRFEDLAAPERVYRLGDEAFPPLRSRHRTNLPVRATPFLGREGELADLVELLGDDALRLLTLSGPGGTGKTRLALQAAAEAAERFLDGIAWVPLAPLRDPSLRLPAVA